VRPISSWIFLFPFSISPRLLKHTVLKSIVLYCRVNLQKRGMVSTVRIVVQVPGLDVGQKQNQVDTLCFRLRPLRNETERTYGTVPVPSRVVVPDRQRTRSRTVHTVQYTQSQSNWYFERTLIHHYFHHGPCVHAVSNTGVRYSICSSRSHNTNHSSLKQQQQTKLSFVSRQKQRRMICMPMGGSD